MTENHCIFCSKNFPYELEPVLGFESARACHECNEEFKDRTAETVAQVFMDYARREGK